MDEHAQSDTGLTLSLSPVHDLIPPGFRAIHFAGGVGVGELPSTRQGDGKFFAPAPLASVCRWLSGRWGSRRPSHHSIVPGPAEPVPACRRQTGSPVRPRNCSYRNVHTGTGRNRGRDLKICIDCSARHRDAHAESVAFARAELNRNVKI